MDKHWVMAPKTPKVATIKDVAAKAQAGKTSISRYLNGEFHLLSDNLRQRIETAIRELNYRPNQMARSLKHGRTGLIGLIIADIGNPFSVEVLKGVEAESIKQGFMTVVCNANNSIERECQFIQLLKGYRVDGLIINSAGVNEQFIDVLKQTTLPFVLLDRKIDNFPCDMVGLDNPASAQMAFNHLLEQGFEAICFVTEPIVYNSARQERLQTFQTLSHDNPQIKSEFHEVTLPNPEKLASIVAEFCISHRGMRKAIVAANGVLTLQLAYAMNQQGLRWGADIGFLSFDNLEWAAFAGQGVTSVSQPTAEMGHKAVTCLLEKLENPEKEPTQHLFHGELIIRNSTTL
ncbi:TPA: LacI family DNA-binding transcriptional regulator [Providencia rettgeri]|nr:LacI family DNA-binding transcriptional regulator [Providencia rettgeri]HEM6889235.1 LacI family DNA-binding transcriptional regulator [Providencia rettgeri]